MRKDEKQNTVQRTKRRNAARYSLFFRLGPLSSCLTPVLDRSGSSDADSGLSPEDRHRLMTGCQILTGRRTRIGPCYPMDGMFSTPEEQKEQNNNQMIIGSAMRHGNTISVRGSSSQQKKNIPGCKSNVPLTLCDDDDHSNVI